jgi:5-oxoprolinase (ATP-hydrolysing) subunit B
MQQVATQSRALERGRAEHMTRIEPVGDAAAIAIIGDTIDIATVRRVWALAALARDRLGASALDVVPAYASVLVRFDPATSSLAHVIACLRGSAQESDEAVVLTPRSIMVAACFDGDHGVDLEETAKAAGLTPALFIKRFCAAEYRVAFLGFLAGFPYLMGLPGELAVPRRPSPRDRVPAGSVAIAGTQCGIYPRVSPGGWRLIAQTNAAVFDPAREPAALFAPGDVVRFEPARSLDTAIAEVAWP